MTHDRVQVTARLQQRLSADAASGWGYYAGKSPRIEPTCWALLSLGADRASDALPAAAGLSLLTRSQRADGLVADGDTPYPNLATNGLAALTLNARPAAERGQVYAKLLAGITALKGVRLEQNVPRQDSRLQGWPWVADTFSWVEPTAWCLLALKRAGTSAPASATARIAEAEKLLINRVCASGGWNYGNASTLGQDLRAYVPTTAVALLAMYDRRSVDAIASSLKWLADNRLSENSTLALALTAIALRLHGIPVDDVEERLMDVVGRAEDAGYLHGIALALYALTASEHRVEALRVGA